MATARAPTPKTFLQLTALYAAEGLPYGFFAQGLPVLARTQGASLGKVGLLALLFLPWALKWMWAPLVDTVFVARWGRRRTWLVGTQAAMVVLLAAMAVLLGNVGIMEVLPLVVLANILSATQDIAVDGYAVSRLDEQSRGVGNAIQVCGYKLGMVAGGGGLLMVADAWGWNVAVAGLALGVLALLPVSVGVQEPVAALGEPSGAPPDWKVTVAASREQLWRVPGAARFVAFIFLVKMGEAAASAMVKPALVDRGFSAGDVGLWVGTVGLVASLLGSAVGGWLAGAMARQRALVLAVLLQAAGLALLWPLLEAPLTLLGGAIAVEHLVTGILTTVLFTAMMDAVDPEHGGTQYSVLASVVVVGTGLGSSLSGFLAQTTGYAPLFLGAAAWTALCALLVKRPARV